MALSPGLTVLIILPAFLLHTSGLYIASSVGEYCTAKRGQCLYSVSDLISYQRGSSERSPELRSKLSGFLMLASS